jgi:hypothetical protein
MQVVIWKVVLPRGRVVKGTAVGETKPTVRYGAKTRDAPGAGDGSATPLDNFCLFTTRPSLAMEEK